MIKYKKAHIKKGDKVVIITGNYKKTIGIVNLVFKKKSLVIINEITPRIKLIKSNKKELPIYIHISNIILWNLLITIK